MDNNGPNNLPSTTTPRSNAGCGSPAVFVLALLWVFFIITVRIAISLIASATPGPAAETLSLTASLGMAVTLLISVGALALFWKDPAYKAIYQTWGLASAFALLLIVAHLPDTIASLTRAALHLALALIAAGALYFIARRRALSQAEGALSGADSLALALLGAALIAVPWTLWGALGSPLDILLDLLSGLGFGLAAAILLDRFLFRPYLAHLAAQGQDFTFGHRLALALAADAALSIIAAGTGFPYGGMQLALILVWGATGWLTVRLRRPLALAALLGLTAAIPLAFIDPDELILVIGYGAGEVLSWALRGTLISGLIAWILGLLLLAIPSPIRRRPRPAWAVPLFAVLALGGWVLALALYFTLGQPGFFGERYFIVLESQADLTPAEEIEDPAARRTFVYRTLVEHATTTQAGLRQFLEGFRLDYTPYYLVNGIEVEGNPLLRLWIASRPEVAEVLQSPRLRPLPEPVPTAAGDLPPVEAPPWNLSLIQADRVWADFGVRGEGIVIGHSDSGVWGGHPELADSYRGVGGEHDYNWFDPWYGRSEPADIGGHGTHTLGIVLGNHTGVAPDATWIGCVNLARNLGNPALYLDCWQFMLAPFPQGGDPFTDGAPELGAHVLNNSWGCPDIEGCDPDTLQPAARALSTAGVFVVVSAGNDGPGCGSLNSAPAWYDEVFSIGSINSSGQISLFSSRGPVPFPESDEVKPDLVAPGEMVISAYPQDGYSAASGTSMAGPHAAGVVALMWSANPDLIGDIQRTEEILKQTARPYSGFIPSCPGAEEHPSTVTGYGILDAYGAVEAALAER